MAENKKGLAVARKTDLLEVFTTNTIDVLLEAIEVEARSVIMDVATAKGRGNMKSMAYKVAQTKVLIDDKGKELVKGWKDQAKQVDAGRRKVRETLDALRDEIRAPLTAWEAEQKVLKEAKKLEADWEIALTENELFDARKREADREESDRLAEEQRKRKEEQEARDEQIRKDAEEQTRRETNETAQAKIDEAQQKEQEALDLVEEEKQKAVQAKIDADKAIEDEKARLQAEVEQKEADRLEEERLQKEEDDRRAADHNHRVIYNTEARDDMAKHGIDQKVAQKLIGLIIKGEISHISIKY